jgi:hypothetical protein
VARHRAVETSGGVIETPAIVPIVVPIGADACGAQGRHCPLPELATELTGITEAANMLYEDEALEAA